MKTGLVVPLDDTWILAESGPMRLQIAAWNGTGPRLASAQSGGEWACGILEELARYQDLIKRKNPWPAASAALPRAVNEMIAAVRRVGDRDLTPLAAVAGTIADLVAEYVFAHGVSKVIVNNGGDIAVRMLPDEVVLVGVRPDVSSSAISHYLELSGRMEIGGVTTSGVGGRSFTKGIAQAAVALGSTASVSDAASTSLANATRIDSPRVTSVVASDLYPDTDLKEERVTHAVGELGAREVEEALASGMARARQYVEKGAIKGAILCVQDRVVWTEGIGSLIFPVTPSHSGH